MVHAAHQASMPSVSVQSAHELMQQGVPMIDVREPAEIAELSVPGTIRVPLGEIEREGAAALARCGILPGEGGPVLMFCRSGNRSGIATRLLTPAFGARVVNVEGGVLAWAEHQLPLERGR